MPVMNFTICLPWLWMLTRNFFTPGIHACELSCLGKQEKKTPCQQQQGKKNQEHPEHSCICTITWLKKKKTGPSLSRAPEKMAALDTNTQHQHSVASGNSCKPCLHAPVQHLWSPFIWLFLVLPAVSVEVNDMLLEGWISLLPMYSCWYCQRKSWKKTNKKRGCYKSTHRLSNHLWDDDKTSQNLCQWIKSCP